MVQVDDIADAIASLEAMVGTIHANLREPKRLGEEQFLIAHVADRERRAEESARRSVFADLPGRPRVACIGGFLHHFEQQSCGMTDAHVFAPEAFLDAAVLAAMAIEVAGPEAGGAVRNRIRGRG